MLRAFYIFKFLSECSARFTRLTLLLTRCTYCGSAWRDRMRDRKKKRKKSKSVKFGDAKICDMCQKIFMSDFVTFPKQVYLFCWWHITVLLVTSIANICRNSPATRMATYWHFLVIYRSGTYTENSFVL